MPEGNRGEASAAFLIKCRSVTDAAMGVKRRNHMKKGIPTRMTVALLAAAIAVCAFGAFRGELDIVMAKAINICMECIGLG